MKPNIQNHRLHEDAFIAPHDSPHGLQSFEKLQDALLNVGEIDLVSVENARDILGDILGEPLPEQLRMELVSMINQLKVLTKTIFEVRTSSNRIINLYKKEKSHRDRTIVPSNKKRSPTK